MSLIRVMEGEFMDWRPIVAMYIFPIISLKFMDSKVLCLLLTAISQIYLNFLVFPGFGDNKNDILFSLALILWFWILSYFITPNLGLE